MSIIWFGWTQAARLLEVSCVSEQSYFPTWFEQLRSLRLSVNEHKKLTRVVQSHNYNSSVTIKENHDGCGQWCRDDCLAFCCQKLPPRCAVLRIGRQHHTDNSQSWQMSMQSQSWPSSQESKCLALCSLCISGEDVYFTHDAGCHAMHTKTREEIKIHHRGGKFEIDAEVVLPFHRHVKP